MEAAGFDIHPYNRGGHVGSFALAVSKDLVGADGFLAFAVDDDFFDGGAAGAGIGIGDFDFLEAGLDDALGGFWDAGGEGEIFLIDEAGFKVAAELVVGVGGFGDDEEAGGFLVEAMEEAVVAADTEVVEEFSVGGEEPVEEAVVGVAFAGLCDHSGGLFDDEQIRVLVDDLEVYGGISLQCQPQWRMAGFLRGRGFLRLAHGSQMLNEFRIDTGWRIEHRSLAVNIAGRRFDSAIHPRHHMGSLLFLLEPVVTEHSPAPILVPAAESFGSILLRRARYLVAVALSGYLFFMIAWHLIEPPPEMGGVSLLVWPSAGGPFAAIAITALLILTTAICTVLVHPDTPHMGLACALVGAATLSIRGGSVHMLIQNAKDAHAYAGISQLLAMECIEWAIIFLFAEFFARFLHDRFFTNVSWLNRTGRNLGLTTAKRLPTGRLAVGASLAFSQTLRTYKLPRFIALPLAMVYSGAFGILLLYVFMQSPLKGQVLLACFIAFYFSTLNAYMAFPNVPSLYFFLTVPFAAGVSYFLWRNSLGYFPGLGGSFISYALPIDFFSVGIPGAIIGYYSALHCYLNTDEQATGA